FGCVLYEMLTGHAAFEGETIGEILAGVFKSEPDWERLPAGTPEAVRRLLRRCLQKDRAQRLNSANAVRIEIEDAQSRGQAEGGLGHTAARRRSNVWVAIAAVLLLTTIFFAALSVVYFNRPEPSRPPEIRVEVNTPSTDDPLSFAISPDARRLVFSALNDGKS